MEFPETTQEENSIAFQEGFRIYGELRKRYPNNNVTDLDIILNSLCAALIRMCELNTHKKDQKNYVPLIHKILTNNLR